MRFALILVAAAVPIWAETPVDFDALGQAAYAEGRYRSAKRYFEQASRDGNPVSTVNLALSCQQLGELTRAEELLRGVLRSLPNHPNVLGALGQVLFAQRRFDEAALATERAVAVRAEPQFLSNLASIETARGRSVEAVQLFERALNQLPPGQARSRVLGNLAIQQWETGERAVALQTLRLALADMRSTVGGKHPDVAMLMEQYAEMLRLSGQKRQAKAYWEQAAEIRSSFLHEDNGKRWTVDWRDRR